MNAARKQKGIKFSEEEEKQIQELADQNGMTFSEYVRRASLGEIQVPNENIEQMFQEIRDELRILRKLSDKK